MNASCSVSIIDEVAQQNPVSSILRLWPGLYDSINELIAQILPKMVVLMERSLCFLLAQCNDTHIEEFNRFVHVMLPSCELAVEQHCAIEFSSHPHDGSATVIGCVS